MHAMKITAVLGAVLLTVMWTPHVGRCQVVTDGLLSYWSFGAMEIHGQIVKDIWGDRDGTILGDPTVVTGRSGEALEFDGDGDCVIFDDSGLPEGNSPRTMSAWVRPEGAGIRSVVEWGSIGPCYRSGVLVLDGEFIKFVGAQGCDVTSNGSIPLSEWSHITETFDGQNLRIYLNGQLDKETGHAMNTVLGEGTIGKKVTQQNEFFNGVIDEVSIYDRALSEAEVTRNFSAESGLVREQARVVTPLNGATDVPRDNLLLVWEAGNLARSHDVYLGTSLDGVSDATKASPEFKGNQVQEMYASNRLALGQTYYWRIDEVNDANPSSPWKGEVWDFTVEPIGYPLSGERIVATASSAKNEEEGPENVVDGSGLGADDLHSITVANMWQTSMGDADPWIEFAFDKPYMLHQMMIWNHNSALESSIGFGIKEATIEYSMDGAEWTILGTVELAQATGQVGYAANSTVAFEGTVAQYVRVLPVSNWGGILPQFGLSEVRFLYVPVWAREPEPAAGTAGVTPEVTLGWRGGRLAATHDVYLSDDEAAVADGTAPVVQVTDTSYQTDPLALGQTYYWRVDEVNDVEDPAGWQGDLWNFTVTDVVVVEDFEGYTDDMEAGEAIFQTWIDGVENGTGSYVGYEVSSNGTFGESQVVHGGKQAMPLFYDNTAGATDSMTTRTFAEAQDWTQSGIQGLVLYFQGSSENTVGQLYVKINDAKVAYDGDAESLMRVGWNKWYIVLSDLDSATLAHVQTLSVGVEGGGQGVIYVDDITLTAYAREMVTPVEPGTAGLVAHYAFEGNAADSTGHHPGMLVGSPGFEPGAVGQAISLSGVGDYVQISEFKGILGANPASATAWIRTTNTPTGSIVGWGPIVNGQQFEFRVNADRLRFEHAGGNIQGDAVINDGVWHHVAVTIQANATISYPEVILWVDGLDNTRPTTDPDPFNLTAGEDARIGSRAANDDRFFMGQIDEVRIYDRVLSPEEIAWLAGRTMPFDK